MFKKKHHNKTDFCSEKPVCGENKLYMINDKMLDSALQ